jgi:glycosyltransferase involved in cell wall biosynthesis
LKILLIEPFFTGSHAAWANGYAAHSRHRVDILKLPGHNWKWRMHGGAVTLARRFLENHHRPDLIVASDMLDVTTFLAITRKASADVPVAMYFHENQLSYPWSPQDRDIIHDRDKHYGFINFASALASDRAYFNSRYHRDTFFEELQRFLKHFPEPNEFSQIEQLRSTSDVLPLGLDLVRLDPAADEEDGTPARAAGAPPLILWNHRWEYDKNADEFFEALKILMSRGMAFEVAVLGEHFGRMPEVFLAAKERMDDRIVQFGYADPAGYSAWLRRADILPVTSRQDFFGASVVEAVYCGCFPLLPRRLAYPELIPREYHARYFYEDFDDLVERLGAAIVDIEATRAADLRSVVEKYDWRVMAPEYDRTFERLAGKD